MSSMSNRLTWHLAIPSAMYQTTLSINHIKENLSNNKLMNTYPNFSMKMNWTMWTTLRISYDSNIPRALRTFETTSKTMYLVNLQR